MNIKKTNHNLWFISGSHNCVYNPQQFKIYKTFIKNEMLLFNSILFGSRYNLNGCLKILVFSNYIIFKSPGRLSALLESCMEASRVHLVHEKFLYVRCVIISRRHAPAFLKRTTQCNKMLLYSLDSLFACKLVCILKVAGCKE